MPRESHVDHATGIAALSAPQATSTKLPDLAKLLGIGIRVTNLAGNGVATKVRWNRVSWRYLVRLA